MWWWDHKIYIGQVKEEEGREREEEEGDLL